MYTCNVALTPRLFDKPIAALRSLRACFHISLAESRDMYNRMKEDGYMVMDLSHEEKTILEYEGFYLEPLEEHSTQNLEYGVMVYLEFEGRSGEKIKAIKCLRGVTGYGLKETKDIIDQMFETRKPVKIGVPVNDVQLKTLHDFGFIVTGTRPKTHFDNELFKI